MVREASHDEFLAMRLLRDRIPGQNERYLAVTSAMLREALEQYSPLRLIKNVSPAEQKRECLEETGECLVETGESRTLNPYQLVLRLLDQLDQIGQTAHQIKQYLADLPENIELSRTTRWRDPLSSLNNIPFVPSRSNGGK